jgi:diaminopimelate epimerase
MRFEKWQALGNDYVIVEAAALPAPLTGAAVRALCDRHTGIGADGILLLEPADEPGIVARLRIFNPDGSEAELSGNGAREAIMYLRHRGWTDSDQFSILTAAGEIRPTILSETTCRMDMGRARDNGPGEVESGGRTWRFRNISIGNPQCAIAVASVEELEALDLAAIGPGIEHAPQFPNRTNVSWYAPTGEPGVIRARIFERGAGETTASGTGASGAAVASVLRGGDSPVTVRLDGGDLEVDVADDLRVDLTGWAVPVYAGELSDADRVFAQRLGE